MEHSRTRAPPGVEEALSSMLWTPYPAESSEETSSDDSEATPVPRKKRPLTWHPSVDAAPPFTIYAPAFLGTYELPPYASLASQQTGMVHSLTDTFLTHHNQAQQFQKGRSTSVAKKGEQDEAPKQHSHTQASAETSFSKPVIHSSSVVCSGGGETAVSHLANESRTATHHSGSTATHHDDSEFSCRGDQTRMLHGSGEKAEEQPESESGVKMRLSVRPEEDEGGKNCLTIEVNVTSEDRDDKSPENGVKVFSSFNEAVPVQIVHNGSNNGHKSCNNVNINCDVIKDNHEDPNKGVNVSIIENINNSDQLVEIVNSDKATAKIHIHAEEGAGAPHPPPHKSQVQVGGGVDVALDREQRRRERRERRAARNRLSHVHNHGLQPPAHPPPPPPSTAEILPDLLHSHLPPPYTTLPGGPGSAAGPTTIITPIPVAAVDSCRYSFPLPIIRRSPSERSGKGCCGQWFAGPSLRALIAVVALGGLACALGGTALGVTSLAGPPQSHFTAALLMIGVGVILVTISGAAWKLTAPGGPPCLGLGTSADLGRCNRRACTRGGNPGHVIYPEFQHRPPPPSYQASMQEYRLRLLLLDRGRQPSILRAASPPPTYRSNTPSTRAPTRGNNTNNNASSMQANASTTELLNSDAIERISTNSSEATLPPSYRTRNRHHHRYSGSHLLSSMPPIVNPRLVYSYGGPASRETVRRGSSLEQLHDVPVAATSTIVNNVNVHSRPKTPERRQKKKELVTIVTISGAVEEDARQKELEERQGESGAGSAKPGPAEDEILAHL